MSKSTRKRLLYLCLPVKREHLLFRFDRRVLEYMSALHDLNKIIKDIQTTNMTIT